MGMFPTVYSDRTDGDVHSLFIRGNWQAMDAGERLQALQEIENRAALEQGREALEVAADPFCDDEGTPKGGVYGEYDGEKLYVNEYLVNDNGFYDHGDIIPQSDVNVQLMDTVLHEGRHAFQDYAVANPGAYDAAETARFEVNNEPGNYIGDGSLLYDLQPTERDAWDYAEGRTREIFQEIKDEYGISDPGFQDYALSSEIRKDDIDQRLQQALIEEPELLDEFNAGMLDRFNAQHPDHALSDVDLFAKPDTSDETAEEAQEAMAQEEEEDAEGEETGRAADEVPEAGVQETQEENAPTDEIDTDARPETPAYSTDEPAEIQIDEDDFRGDPAAWNTPDDGVRWPDCPSRDALPDAPYDQEHSEPLYMDASDFGADGEPETAFDVEPAEAPDAEWLEGP